MKPIIVINSHINSSIALNHLLDSMKLYSNFYSYEIIICLGGYYELKDYDIKKEGNITYIKCYHNSIDFTGLITIYELYKTSKNIYLYLHDTMKVGSNFFNKLKDINLNNITSIRINNIHSMNIGFYTQYIINFYKYFLLSKKNINKDMEKYHKIKSDEDYIFDSDNHNIVLDNYKYDYSKSSEPIDYYKTGILRVIEYYENIDIYKMKANWGPQFVSGNVVLSN